MPQVTVINSHSDMSRGQSHEYPPGAFSVPPPHPSPWQQGCLMDKTVSLMLQFSRINERERIPCTFIPVSITKNIQENMATLEVSLRDFPLCFLNFKVRFPQTCRTFHKKLLMRCLPGLPRAQAREALLHKECHLRGPMRASVCIHSCHP